MDPTTRGPGAICSPAEAFWARRAWLQVMALICLVTAAYGQTLGFEFVFEDPTVFVASPALQGRVGWREILTSSTAVFLPQIVGADRAYRPVLAVSVAVDRAVWGLHPGRLHISGALAHLAVVLLVWRLAWRLSGSGAVGFLAAGLLAVHPSAVEAVAYLSARMDIFVGLGIAAVLLLLRRCAGPRGGWRLGGALVCFAFALGSKETAMAIPPIVTGAAWVHPGWLAAGETLPSRLALAVRVLPFWAILVVYGVVRRVALGSLAPVPIRLARIPSQILGALVGTETYVGMTLIPQPTRGMYTVDPPASLDDGRAFLGILMVAALLLSSLWLPRRHPAAALALGWYVLALVPASNLLPIYYEEVLQIAERSLYPALVGWCLLLALGAHALWMARRPGGARTRPLAWAVSCVVLGTFLVVTALKVGAWRDDVTLWKASLAAHPTSFLTRLSLGWALARAGDLRGAQAVVQEATARFPPDHRMAFLAGWVAEARGDGAEALRQYERAFALGSRQESAYLQAAMLAARQGRLERAARWFQTAADLYPRSAWPHVGLGWYHERQDRPDLARAHFEQATRLQPDSPERLWVLSQLLGSEGRTREAVEAARGALALDPSFLPARRALAWIAEQAGRTAEAMGHWRRLAEALPGRQRDEALAHLRRLEAEAMNRPLAPSR